MKDLNKIEDSLNRDGWVVFKPSDPEPIRQMRRELLIELRRISKNPSVTLENYHEIASDDARHTEFQIHLTEYLRQKRLARRVVEANLDFFNRLIGRDLNVQANPYLRITRPFKSQDNVIFHRDTFYGSSPFELSVWIPLVDVDAKAAMSVVTGSHVLPDSDFPFTQVASTDPEITRGSPKQKLGFLYAPKVIEPSRLKNAVPIPVHFGEILIFGLSLIHGSSQNSSVISRWSTDIRLVNPLVPVDWEPRAGYYEPLCRSVLTEKSFEYLKANARSAVAS